MTYYSFAQQAHVFESEYQGYKPYTDGWETFPFARMTLEECGEAAHQEARRLLDEAGDFYAAAVNESEEYSDEGEPLYRNRTIDEIMQELKEDMPYLETHLYRWMVEAGEDPQDDPAEGGSEPLPEDLQEDEEENEDLQPIALETAIKLIHTDGIYIKRTQGREEYTIRQWADKYIVMWALNGTNALLLPIIKKLYMTEDEVIALIHREAQLGATFYLHHE